MTRIRKIWKIESGEYDQCVMHGVAFSVTGCIALVDEQNREFYKDNPQYRHHYPGPKWTDPVESKPGPGLGHYPHWVVSDGTTEYSITECDFFDEASA